jgi:hypothetical protein
MKLFYDPTVFDNLASESLKAHEQTFCKWAHRHFQSAYGVGFKYLKDELQKANIVSWDAWRNCPQEKLNDLLGHTRQCIGLMYESFNHHTTIYFTEQDLAVLACKMCLAALHELKDNPTLGEENK